MCRTPSHPNVETENPPSEHAATDAASVLIVDDESRILESLCLILSHHGFRVSRAGTGEAAISLLKASHYELAILDMKMEPVSGLDVLRYINEQRIGTAVLFLSGSGDVQSVAEAFRGGAVDFLTKPFAPETLIEHVRSSISTRRILRTRSQAMSQLARSEQFHRLLVNASPDLVFLLNTDLKLLFSNERLESLLGRSANQILGTDLADLFPVRNASHMAWMCRALRSRDLRRVTLDAELATPLPGEGSHVSSPSWEALELLIQEIRLEESVEVTVPFHGYYCVARNLTERKAAELALRVSEQKVRAIIQSTAEGIVGLNPEGRCTFANRAAVTMLGFQSEDHLVGRDFHALVHPSHLVRCGEGPGLCSVCWESGEELEMHHGESLFSRVDGVRVAVEFHCNPITGARGLLGQVISFCDITERLATQRRLEYLANHDPLTEIANRGLFIARLGEAIARAKRGGTRFALVYVDLDLFKPVNDRFGHRVGDEVLLEVAHRLKNSIREVDTAARLGGDEFALLLEQVDSREQAMGIVAKIRMIVSETIMTSSGPVNVTFSSGVAIYPEDGHSPDLLISAADTLMYADKRGP